MSPWPNSPWSASTRPIRRPQTFYNALPQFGAICELGLELSVLRIAGVRTGNSVDRIPLEGATWRVPLPSIQSHSICYVTLRPEVMMAHQETFVQRDQHRIYVRDHPGRNRRSFSCTGSRTTYTSTTVCLLTCRRRAGSCYLIFSGGAVRISRTATLLPLTIKSVTSTPSSPN